jgi:hypothetical protein
MVYGQFCPFPYLYSIPLFRRLLIIAAPVAIMCCSAPVPAAADSPSLMGPLGLIAVPSARMDEPGTIRAHVGMAEPYIHAHAGAQLAAPLYVGVRQSARSSSINQDPDRLYPGVDIRLRLLKENAYVPDITLGLQSATGHKRMAAEYIAATKRIENFDITGGIAWGRLGSAAHMTNPMKAFGNHFGKARSYDGEEPNAPENWFTGPDIGFFAGVEYDTPWVDGLSLKAEWGADRYAAERAAFNHDAPEPWAVGASYTPKDWVTMGIGLIGGDRLLASLSLQNPLKKWPGRASPKNTPETVRPVRTGEAVPGEIEQRAVAQQMVLAGTDTDGRTIWTWMENDPHIPVPRQIGRAARSIANHGGQSAEAIEITPMLYGLRGPSVRLLRRDIEQAFAQNNGSPPEIWRNAVIAHGNDAERPRPFRMRLADAREKLRLIGDTQGSLSEEDSGTLYRTGIIAETRQQLSRTLMLGGAVRVNLKSNLKRLNEYRPVPLAPVREDIDVFTANAVTLERVYMGWFKSFNTDLHVMAAAGYLEEMYAGYGGEVLARPFGKTFAIGVEGWQAFKRDPFTDMAAGFTGDSIITGHVNAYYEIPDTDLTLHAKVGRYLGGDRGATLALRHRFDHGGHVEAFATATNAADFDLFGGTTHIYSGLKFTMPIGNLRPLPRGSEIRVTAAQMGRASGQTLDRPMPLYDATDDFSMRRIAGQWNEVGE